MSQPHEEHTALISTPKQLIAVVLAAFLVPIIGIFLLIKFVMTDAPGERKAESYDRVMQRIQPVGNDLYFTDKPVPAMPAAPAAMPAMPKPGAMAVAQPAAAGAGKGKAVYDATCQMCHGAGLAGAPKLGDKAAWAPRIATGIASLYNSALAGKNAMPAKGGNAGLADADVKAAVDFMVSASK